MKNEILGSHNEICYFGAQTDGLEITCPSTSRLIASIPRPLLIGVSVVSIKESLLIMGGSAVCFSFGTFWNKGCFEIDMPPASANDDYDASETSKSSWQYIATGSAKVQNTSTVYNRPQVSSNYLPEVPRIKVQSSEEFSRIVEAKKPVIFNDSSIGSCTDLWTPTYLKDKVGSKREVCYIFNVILQSNSHIRIIRSSFIKPLHSIWIFRQRISPT